MKLYDAIFYRRSVRKFSMAPLEDDFVKHLKCFVNYLTPYDKEIKVDFLIVDNSNGEFSGHNIFQVQAPYYLLMSSQKTENTMINAGYLMQQVVLFLTSKGIGTCYQGNFKPSEQMLNKLKYNFTAALAFGIQAENKRPNKAVSRLALEKVARFKENPRDDVKVLVEAAMAAPSAFNSQPWRFVVYNNRIHIFAKKDTISINLSDIDAINVNILQYFKHIGIGAALANLIQAAESIGIKTEFRKLERLTVKSFKSNDYIISVILHY